jgi:hypothetical protein
MERTENSLAGPIQGDPKHCLTKCPACEACAGLSLVVRERLVSIIPKRTPPKLMLPLFLVFRSLTTSRKTSHILDSHGTGGPLMTSDVALRGASLCWLGHKIDHVVENTHARPPVIGVELAAVLPQPIAGRNTEDGRHRRPCDRILLRITPNRAECRITGGRAGKRLDRQMVRSGAGPSQRKVGDCPCQSDACGAAI